MEKPVEVLLVEDNEDDAELTVRALKIKMPSYEYIVAKDGQQALDYIFGEGAFADRVNRNPPALIILDLDIPKVRGTEVLRRIKNNERTKRIPVVVLTISKDSPDLRECYELGANSYIIKPVNFVNFSLVVSEVGYYWLFVNADPPKE